MRNGKSPHSTGTLGAREGVCGMTGPQTVDLARPASGSAVSAHGTRSRASPPQGDRSRAVGVADRSSVPARSPSEIGTGEVVSVTLRLQFHPVVQFPFRI